MKKVVVIVAGGSGSRMADNIPKQFLLLKGEPILMRTIRVFYQYDAGIEIIVVIQSALFCDWENLCRQFKFDIKHILRPAGETRFHSVQNGIEDIKDDCLIAIHDGVRPLVNLETIKRCFDAASEYGNAVPCVSIPETMRKVDGDRSVQVDREGYRLIQTPQVFKCKLLKEAYNHEYMPEFTDDAGVVERLGHEIHLVEGNPENIKITIRKDLKIAEALMDVSFSTTYKS